jgi:hypothetical protein
MRVNVKIDLSGMLKKFDNIREESPKVIARTLNKVATSARAQAAREITNAGYGIKQAAIRRQLSIRRATFSELTAVIKATGRPIPLSNYGARQNKQGVSVAVLHGRKTIKSAFIATMKSGHVGVFVRVGSAAERSIGRGRYKEFKLQKVKATTNEKHGLPIRQLFGPSVPNAFANRVVQDALRKAIKERFGVVFAQQLKFARITE